MPYQPSWADAFEAERRRLAATLAPWLADRPDSVHHIGSTSVPGLSAKPVLDMMAGVRSLAGAATAIEPLGSLGYAHAPHRPDALWFFRPGDQSSESRTHHLHLTVPDSALWRERLAFRDALRADPALAGEYADLKANLSAAYTVYQPEYTRGKRSFVARVLADGGIAL